MSFQLVEQPIPGTGAFRDITDAGLLSQAAILLGVGAHMRLKTDILPEESSVLEIPRVTPHVRAEETLLDPSIVRGMMTRQFGERSFPTDVSQPIKGSVSADIFETLAEKPDPVLTAGLLESCLRRPEELVRVSAAAAYHQFTSERERILKILVDGTFSNEPLVRILAATALAQAKPDHQRLNQLAVRLKTMGAGGQSHTTLLVHGTFARQEQWWQPGGDFHNYLTGALPALSRTPSWSAPYAAADRFDWTGGYSQKARADAAKQLFEWVRNHDADGLDLITHSYGGDVAMHATTLGLNVGELVLLSCPALPAQYFPDFARVKGPVVSFRVRMDLVLLLDSYVSGAESKFKDPRIKEHKLSLWFDHSATHAPQVWDNPKYRIPACL